MGESFEWQPDLEGVKTPFLVDKENVREFEWQPDLEGVKTPPLRPPVSLPLFEWQPDLEGVKTFLVFYNEIHDFRKLTASDV